MLADALYSRRVMLLSEILNSTSISATYHIVASLQALVYVVCYATVACHQATKGAACVFSNSSADSSC